MIEYALHGDDPPPSLPGNSENVTEPTIEGASTRLPWFMSVTLATRPRCFGCGGRLLPKVVMVQSDFALCEQCARIDWSDYRPFWLAIQSLGSPLELSRSRGIVFWTPPVTLPQHDAYLRWIELWDIMSGPRDRTSGRRRRYLSPPFVPIPDPTSSRGPHASNCDISQ